MMLLLLWVVAYLRGTCAIAEQDAVDGGYGGWGGWGPCTKECGGGLKERFRWCNAPTPTHGGKQCTGSNTEREECNTEACKVLTFGGNSNGAPCVFPHTYQGVTYRGCHLGVIGTKPWCCTVADCGLWYARKWGYCQAFPKWDHLSVTFRHYDALPMTEAAAKDKRWELIADDCKDASSPFHGRRYMYQGEHSTILVFDVNGGIAGMQMAYNSNLKQGKYGKYAGAYHEVTEKDGSKYFYTTAYFMDPKLICNPNVTRTSEIGDRLVFFVGKDKYVQAPLLSKDVAGTNWKLGKCFIYMGIHYWYDISTDMDCDDQLPFFLMYNTKGQLHGWGFTSDVYVTGTRVERPPSSFIFLFFKKKTFPQCLPKLANRSTQHVYFTKVGWTTHLCF